MPFPRVSTGQPFRPSASSANRTAAAVEAIERHVREPHARPVTMPTDRQLVFAKNGSDTDIPMYGVVAATQTLFVPSENLDSFRNRPAIVVGVPDETTLGRFGIAIEPIAAGRFGRVVFVGMAVAQVEVTDPDAWEAAEKVDEVDRLVTAAHGTARIIARETGDTGLKWALVELGVGIAPGIRWKVDATSAVGGSSPPQWKYTLKRATSNGFGTIAVATNAETVYAYNDFEDQDDWGHGQTLSPGGGMALTPLPVAGPVGAQFAGVYDSDDGTPIYRFDAACPMTSTCEGISGGTGSGLSQPMAEDIAEGI